MSRPFGLQAGLTLRTDQRQVLQPRQLQAVHVLQLPATELATWLEARAEENPVLSYSAPERRASADGQARTEAHAAWLESQPERPPSLSEVVERQMVAFEIEDDLALWMRFLISCLDERGHLSTDDGTLLQLAEQAGMAASELMLGRAIAGLQGLEPCGLGARDALEAMLLQLEPTDPDYFDLCELIERHLDNLAKGRHAQVAGSLEVSTDELARLLVRLSKLDPRPVAALVESAAPTLIPELVVEEGEDGFEVRLERGVLPTVSLDEDLVGLARAGKERTWLRGRIDEARAVVEAVAQRRVTLLRVARSVLKHQLRWLENGEGHRIPLTMVQVASELELAVSTISRAVAGKSVQTPHGVVPLRGLFQAEAGGLARDDAREAVRVLVESENRTKPMSDDAIADLLRSRGLDLARRTVAKYRLELSIPSSYARRRPASSAA
jgi:RNA polymerase sigma-54 factor